MKKGIIALVLFIATQLLGTLVAGIFIMLPDIVSAVRSGGEINLISTAMSSDAAISITIWGLIISEIMLFALLWLMKYFKPADMVKPVPCRTLCISIPLILAAMFVLNELNGIIDLPNYMEEQFVSMSKSFWAVISIALFGPVIEEIVFRRVILSSCLEHTGKPWAAILISAALFGLIHFNPAQSVFAFLIGILFGWVYYRTGSMMPGLIGHVINNSVCVIQMRCAGEEALTDDTVFYQDTTMLVLFIVCSVAAVILTVLLQRTASEGDSSPLQSAK